MKILIISAVRYRSNGISNVIKNLYCNEVFREEDMSFLFPRESDAQMIAELEGYGYKVYHFPRYEKGEWAYLKYVRKIIQEEKIEIVHIHGNSHALVIELLGAFWGGCKVRICHSHNTTCNNTKMHKLLTPIFQMLCNGHYACGREAGIWMYGKRPFHIVNNGIRTARFVYSELDRKRIRQLYGIKENEFVIGHVGNLNEQKNHTVLIDIIARLEKEIPCKCLLVGEGDKRDALEEKVVKLGLSESVKFCGLTNEVPSFLSAMDMIVMPSLYEGLPLSLIEEQANGLVCVVADTITNEVDKTGLVHFCRLDNIQEWVNSIQDNMPDNTKRAESSENAIKKIIDCNYDIEHEIQTLHDAYRSLV